MNQLAAPLLGGFRAVEIQASGELCDEAWVGFNRPELGAAGSNELD
jgi:hypothetical protein